jgi:hypothetical protein
MMMKKFRGHQRCTHGVVSEHHGTQDDRYDDPKKKQNRTSNDMMRNRFLNRSVQ